MISAPSIITAIDDTIDVSLFYSLSEEEEKEGKEDKTIELLLSELNNLNSDFNTSDDQNKLRYYFKRYTKPHLNLISPPPEFHL